MPVDIPGWLLERFNANFEEDPHYEASYYGPINMLLTSYFPATNNFIVKPQARLQMLAPPGVQGSRDSYGRNVIALAVDHQPDFVVCKVLEKRGQVPAVDVPLLILEAKRGVRPSGSSEAQIERYMDWARGYQVGTAQSGQGQGGQRQIKVDYLYAVLVKGGECEVYLLREMLTTVFYYNIVDDFMRLVFEDVISISNALQ